MLIGPNSGYVNINNKDYLLWDIYCHYERLTTKLDFIINDECKIKILNKKVDYSKCRREYNFNNINYELHLKTIYYIGDKLEFIEGN